MHPFFPLVLAHFAMGPTYVFTSTLLPLSRNVSNVYFSNVVMTVLCLQQCREVSQGCRQKQGSDHGGPGLFLEVLAECGVKYLDKYC